MKTIGRIINRRSVSRKIPIYISILVFLTPFCYPFRPVISRYIHVHVYIVMYSTLAIIAATVLLKIKIIQMTYHLGWIFMYFAVILFFSPDLDSGIKWIVNILLGIILGNLLYYYHFELINSIPFILGAIVCGFFLQPAVIQKFPLNFTYIYNVRIPFMDGDVSIGPNTWAFTLSICFLLAALIFCEYSKKIIRVFSAVCMMLIIWLLILTQSRTEIYALFMCLIMMIYKWTFPIKGKSILGIMHVILLFTMIAALIIILFIPNVIFSGNSRITTFDFNGRLTIWMTAIYVFLTMNPIQWLIGVGTGGASVYIFQNAVEIYRKLEIKFDSSGIDHISTHNIYFDALISSGIIGMSLVMIYWIKAFFLMLTKKKCLLFVFPAFVLITGLAGSLFMSWDFCILIAIVEYWYYVEGNAKEKIVRVIYRE